MEPILQHPTKSHNHGYVFFPPIFSYNFFGWKYPPPPQLFELFELFGGTKKFKNFPIFCWKIDKICKIF